MNHHLRRAILATAALLVAFGASACGNASDRSATVAAGPAPTANAQPAPAAAGASNAASSAPAAAADPCQLLTPADARAALGADPGPSDSHPPVCEYATARGRLILTVNRDHASDRFEFLRQEMGQRDVAGLGDRAFLGSGTVFVLKGSVLVQVTVDTTGRPGSATLPEDALLALARAAVNRV